VYRKTIAKQTVHAKQKQKDRETEGTLQFYTDNFVEWCVLYYRQTTPNECIGRFAGCFFGGLRGQEIDCATISSLFDRVRNV